MANPQETCNRHPNPSSILACANQDVTNSHYRAWNSESLGCGP